MRIVIVLPRGYRYCSEQSSSIETVVRTLNAHSRYRRETLIIADAGAGSPSGPEVLTVPAGLDRQSRTRAVAALLQTLEPDIVEHHQQLHCSVALARRLPRCRHVFYRHTRLDPPKHLFDRWRYHIRLKPFDRLVFVSAAAVEEFCSDYPGFASRALAIRNPISMEGWRGDPARRERLILFAGRPLFDKGFDLVCEALAQVLPRAPGWRAVLMLGDWDRHADWAEAQLARLGPACDQVEVQRSAPLSLVMATARRAAIALTPSRVREALGLSALEAHAAGAALISSGRGGLREASGPNAVFVEPETADPLAEALLRLIDNPEERQALAARAQQFVARAHAPADRAGELDQLRLELMATRAHSTSSAVADEPSPSTALASARRVS